MNCTVIQDLLILYADDCCSEESKALVEEHLRGCEACRKALEEMNADSPVMKETGTKKTAFPRINSWKASLMQSVLLYVSFALLVFGVAQEAATPEGSVNGLWALALVVPVTGFLLSLANWYFIRLYPSRKAFSVCSLLVTAVFILLAYVWALLHYRSGLLDLFSGSALSTGLLILGCVFTIALCIVSKLFSGRYALLLGKE